MQRTCGRAESKSETAAENQKTAGNIDAGSETRTERVNISSQRGEEEEAGVLLT